MIIWSRNADDKNKEARIEIESQGLLFFFTVAGTSRKSQLALVNAL